MTGPLAGLRVLELAGIGPGPFAAMVLADLGAEVVRVERQGVLDFPGMEILNRGKASVIIDLKEPSGVGAVLDLVSAADILIEGYRPGVAERLGVGPEQCLARNPRLIYGRMTGWGQSGPLAMSAGHDINYLAVAGTLHMFGRQGQPPAVPANIVGDFAGGSLYLVVGLLAALRQRAETGRGEVVDACIVDGAANLAASHYGMLAAGNWTDARGANLLDTGRPWYDVYATGDGKFVAVGAIEPQFWAALLTGLELTEDDVPPRGDESRWPELRAQLAGRFLTRTRDEWAEVFAGTDACVTPVLSMLEAAEHPHAISRGTWLSAPRGGVQPAPAPRFASAPPRQPTRPPVPGADTQRVLESWGVPDVVELIGAGVAVETPAAVNS